jgi:hypothetical protein
MLMIGELKFFFGSQVSQSDKGIFISQTKYIKEMLRKFQMEDCKTMSTPMIIGYKLSKDDESLELDQTMYRSMIGILLYATTRRPNIMQVVGLVVRFQYAPKETHMKGIKMIFRYLKGTLDFLLWYPKAEDFTLTTYTDADWEGRIDGRKSTSGGAFFLGKCLMSWLSKKKPSISLSTTEVEYIVIASCFTQEIWMKQTLEYLQVKYDHPILLNCDNTNAINILKILSCTKKPNISQLNFIFLRERVSLKIVKVEYVDTKEHIADIFTKHLPISTFENLRHKLGVISISN